MAKLKEYNGIYCESEYEYAFISFLENEGWNYKSGKDIYLGCWCAPNPCHAEIIAKKLQQKLIKEKLEERKTKKEQLK